jgi:hypothetical protein
MPVTWPDPEVLDESLCGEGRKECNRHRIRSPALILRGPKKQTTASPNTFHNRDNRDTSKGAN